MSYRQVLLSVNSSGFKLFPTKHGIITDIHVTPGNIHDSEPYVKRLSIQKHKYGLNIQKVGADKGYDSSLIHQGLTQLEITGNIVPRQYDGIEDKDGKSFIYNPESDSYTCPEGKSLPFTYVEGKGVTYKQVYTAKTKDCKVCPLRETCFTKSKPYRKLTRPLFHQTLEQNRNRFKSPEYKRIQRLRSIWCEGTFGTMKQEHNLLKTYKKGIRNALNTASFLLWL